MEKLTLTRKEAAQLLGISTATVTQWVLEGRLKAYRVSERPKSPYLFTREDCQAAISAVRVQPRAERHSLSPNLISQSTALQNHRLDKELNELLKIRTKGRPKE